MSRTAVILLAAGSGARMNGSVADKVLAPLAGRPVFAHSAAAFMQSQVADLYVIVYRDQRQMMELSAYAPTPSVLVRGGRERQDSVTNALAALPPDIAHVFIHDCARPLVRAEQLVALHKIVRRENAVVLARRVTDTIKEHRDDACLRTLDRARLWAMETPQVFDVALLREAYAMVMTRRLEVTDEVSAVQAIGMRVKFIEANHPNPKITRPSDLVLAAAILTIK